MSEKTKDIIKLLIISQLIVLILGIGMGASAANAMSKKKVTKVVVIDDNGDDSQDSTQEEGNPISGELEKGAEVITDNTPIEPEEESVFDEVEVDDEVDGYDLGVHNAKALIKKIVQSTVEKEGCSAQPKLQYALAVVAINVQMPNDLETELAEGFIKGYLDTIALAINDSQVGCGLSGCLTNVNQVPLSDSDVVGCLEKEGDK